MADPGPPPPHEVLLQLLAQHDRPEVDTAESRFLRELPLEGLCLLKPPPGAMGWLSPRFRVLLGAGKEELGRDGWHFWVECMEAATGAAPAGIVEAAITEGPGHRVDEVLALHSNGSVTGQLHLRGLVVETAAGPALLLVHELVEAPDAGGGRETQELLAARRELELARAELEEFTHKAGHDLKAPVRAIRDYANFLLEDHGSALDEDGRRMLEALPRLTGRLDDLVDSLLEHSRLGREELLQEPVSLADALCEAVAAMEEELSGSRKTQLHLPADEQLAVVPGNPERIAQLLQILLRNALQYSDSSPREVHLSQELTELPATDTAGPRPAVRILIRDNGIGIPEEHQGAVFEMFRRLHGPSEYGGGAGAGLALARRTVERHGGSMELRSTPGEGTVVAFTLPRL